MLFECTAWITAPEPRNSRALKNACVHRWKNPAVTPSGPIESPATMYASWLIVENARTRLMSSCTNASRADITIVIPAMIATNWSTNGSACTKISNIRPTR
jgi:hypothetical protein